ncbi:permease [Ehrlichia ruminantium]|uniref:Permease n=1 Tax=Ehrlichia ruminantium TaxID=779 RepID=A0AAE6Q9G2_EHRRU|nr:AEC family transporter [Ehrlichia ruminantium]QGR02828.1 permease [Ehrlichia ruminantium]QGR03752.1 permease [Ehrlichia ruminantium]QGR04679.1 permease [Ehrlichia ruminantium]
MFLVLLLKILPVYITVLLGFISGKLLKIDSPSIAKLLFYIVGPLVIFFGISQVHINPEILSLPFLTCLICCIMSTIVYYTSAFVFRDNTRNILAFSSGSSSMGFFGLPLALAMFDDNTVSIYLFCYVGMLIFENSFGFYLATQGIYTTKKCLIKLITLPAVYAAIAALSCSYFHITIPTFLSDFAVNIRGTYVILGMMLLGVAVANIKNLSIDWKLISLAVIIKYILWPALVIGYIIIDKLTFQLYDNDIYRALILIAIVPMSGTSIILATILNNNPDKIALMLLINTIIGLFYVPMMISLLLS